MTALRRVRSARRTLVAAVALAVISWSVAAALAVICAAAFVQLLHPLPLAVHAAVGPTAVVAAVVTAVALLWRWRMAASLERIALWIEERQPELRYTLVTAIDPVAAPEDRYPAVHEQARAADVEGHVRRAAARLLGRALPAAASLVALTALLEPRSILDAARTELARAHDEASIAELPNRLESMTAVVTPPAYTRVEATTIESPSAVAALVGSRIDFGGTGPAHGVVAVIDEDTRAAEEAGKRWRIRVTMPREPVVVAFHDREYRRLVVLEPRTDSVPTVRLRLPAADTVYKEVPSSRLVIEAEASDDIGLDYGYVEYLITSGSGENFETRQSLGRRVAFGNARRGTISEAIRLDTLGLAPGSVLHIRAVAYDANDVTGPGRGVSETRTLRIAEPEDSVSVAPIPPIPIDSMWISQRLLNMKTDTLLQRKNELTRQEFLDTSSAYGGTQDEIRMRTLAVIATLEDDGVGGTFETEISRMLREAVGLMYEARVHLGVGEPDLAMPIMIRILEILDEIRLANRYYLRGLVRPEAIDVERVRLSGEDPGADVPRKARKALSDPIAPLADRIGRAVALIETAPQAAIDSLVYARVAALTHAPEAADAIAELVATLQNDGGSRDAEARRDAIDRALARIRRALEPPPQRIDGPVEWRGIP